MQKLRWRPLYDLDAGKLRDLRTHTPVNRLSIGIQSFREEDLKWMNRAHNAVHAQACLRDAAAAGFDDLTIPTAYGAPTTSDAQWRENLSIAFDYGIPHLSCYCLTVKKGRRLAPLCEKGNSHPSMRQQPPGSSNTCSTQLPNRGMSTMKSPILPGLVATPGTTAVTGWRTYLGVGPSAHSFNGWSRQSGILPIMLCI